MFRSLFIYAVGLVLLLCSANVLGVPVLNEHNVSIGSPSENRAARDSNAEAAEHQRKLRTVYDGKEADARKMQKTADGRTPRRSEEKVYRISRDHNRAAKLFEYESTSRDELSKNPEMIWSSPMTPIQSKEKADASSNTAKAALICHKASKKHYADCNDKKGDNYAHKAEVFSEKSLHTVPGSKYAVDIDLEKANRDSGHAYRGAKKSLEKLKKKKEEGHSQG